MSILVIYLVFMIKYLFWFVPVHLKKDIETISKIKYFMTLVF